MNYSSPRLTRHLAVRLFAMFAVSLWAAQVRAQDFSGFPDLTKPGDRSFDTITSDLVPGLLRPDWTRAMSDVGGWPAMFRFQGDIYLEFQSVDGHRGANGSGTTGATADLMRYKSSDNGKTWTELPTWATGPGNTVGEYVVAGNTLYRYVFNGATMKTEVRTSTDGINFTAPQSIYQSPYWFWGTIYDDATKTFWAAPHALTDQPGQREIQLLKSKDGVNWDYVSTLHGPGDSESETTLDVDKNGEIVALIRKKWQDQEAWMVTANAPFNNPQVTQTDTHVSGEHFFEIDGETFLATRAYLDRSLYTDEDFANSAKLGYLPTYAMIYKFTDDHQLIPWAVVDSMGDSGYPYLVETPDAVLVGYYSQHEDMVDKVYMASFDKQEFLTGSATPEPCSMSLMGLGGAALSGFAYRRWKRQRVNR